MRAMLEQVAGMELHILSTHSTCTPTTHAFPAGIDAEDKSRQLLVRPRLASSTTLVLRRLLISKFHATPWQAMAKKSALADYWHSIKSSLHSEKTRLGGFGAAEAQDR